MSANPASAPIAVAEGAQSADSALPTGVPSGLAHLYASLLKDDLAALNHLIPRQLTSDVGLVEEIGRYIVESGGKRLRPLLVLLGARCCGYEGDAHIRLAAIIEFLHTATLLHDDVVDRSALRRGRQTANAVWGNAPSVLVGDFLYSRAFQLMVELQSLPIMGILSNATNTIAEGEVQQLAKLGDLALDESQYMEVIRCKTALLFEAATHTAGELAGQTPAQIEALRKFGLHFGLAYQLMDDYLDYAGETEVMGKNAGDDLAEGKVTLPLIYGMANADQPRRRLLRDAIAAKSSDGLGDVLAVVRECGALAYTQSRAKEECYKALKQLDVLPGNAYRAGLEQLCNYSLSRLA
ncbi:MAG: polyprenyl synthetase family protein [Pseudomonadales bacterium]